MTNIGDEGRTRRFQEAQKDRTLHHWALPQPPDTEGQHGGNNDGSTQLSLELKEQRKDEEEEQQQQHTHDYFFVVAADTQFGIFHANQKWEDEKEYSRQAVAYINSMEQRPVFCCVSGDLVEMTAENYATTSSSSSTTTTTTEEGEKEQAGDTKHNNDQDKNNNDDNKRKWTREECDRIQDEQNADFQAIWSDLHPDIALLTVCGNHDIGDQPTPTSIQRFQSTFGDDYFAFWVQDSYHIVINTCLFSDCSKAAHLFEKQWIWLQERLSYARPMARHIFVFGHHPWFLYHEEEDTADLTGYSPTPGMTPGISDAYFVIPRSIRQKAMTLFAKYNVTAAFAGHFHQNMVSQATFGMHMIVTSSLSMVIRSTGIPPNFQEPNTRGLRIVHVQGDKFTHEFVSIP